MSNQHTAHTAPGRVVVTVFDIDDEVNVWLGKRKVWGNGDNPVNEAFNIGPGESIPIRFELYNRTGGRYHAEFTVSSGNGTLYSHTPDGIGGPQNIAFSVQVNVICR